MKTWDGFDLEGKWDITLKIDGVQAIYKNFGADFRYVKPVSRKDNELYNLPNMPEGIYEVYMGDFKKSIQATRTKNKAIEVTKDNLYQLLPVLDLRLFIESIENPTSSYIKTKMHDVIANGFEGLVLRGPNGEVLKVKPTETHDVEVTGYTEGTGRDKGTLACFITPMGKVNVKKKKDKIEYYGDWVIGETIEVECMKLTANGKFRHARFKHMRYDK